MLKINLNQTPNQKFGISISGVNYDITLKLGDGILYASVSADNVVLSSGVRCIPSTPIIPYPYLTKGGNFYWLCDDNDYPDWEKFNDQHVLIYATDEEADSVV